MASSSKTMKKSESSLSRGKQIWFLEGRMIDVQPVANLGVQNPIQPVPIEQLQSWITPTPAERVMHAKSRYSARDKFLSDLKSKGITPLDYYKCSLFDSISNEPANNIHNTYHCSSYNCSTIIHPPLEFFVNAEKAWKLSCLGYFVDHALNKKSNLQMVQQFMTSRFGSWGFNFINFDESGFFYFKFDNEEIRDKVISLGPVNIGGMIFVFGPIIHKYPSIKYTLDTCTQWVNIKNIPRPYWSVEGLTYIAETLGTIIHKDGLSTWSTSARNETGYSAKICLQMSLMHSRPKHILVVVPGIDETFTHARITIEYIQNGKMSSCSLCCSLEHLEKKCPHIPGFERDYNLIDCSDDPLVNLCEDSSSTATSHAGDPNYATVPRRGITSVVSPHRSNDVVEGHDSNMEVD